MSHRQHKPNEDMKTKHILQAMLAISSLMLTCSCGNSSNSGSNWLQDDDVKFAADETLQPIMQDLSDTFGMAYPEANMKPLFVSEDSALRLLVSDSLRCCISTRPLSENERKVVEGHHLGVNYSLIATDAIALIVNKENPDSLLSLDEVKGIVSGRITRWEQLKHHSQKGEIKLVFDHSGSSTVRFMKDSLCQGQDLKGNVYASEGGTNLAVIDMVKSDPKLIGVVGTNWLKGNSQAPLADFSKLDVKVMRISRTADEFAKYVRPFQSYIATADYPLLRSAYIIHTDPRSKSFVRSFYYFAKGQKGQTIICNNSQLLPIAPVQIKDVSVN